MTKNNDYLISGLEIAIVGMAGRFPGARNINEFEENLKKGIESITFFSDEELVQNGVSPDLLKNPNFVKAGAILEDLGYFDSSFFDYSPREAAIMSPQMQLFHECAWEALEDAGVVPDSYNDLIGVYVGSNSTLQWEALCQLSGENQILGNFASSHLNSKDFLSTKTSYALNLKGPSVTIYTACSTSLVAIHMACQAILSGECTVALAGGVRIEMPQKNGYFYEEGMVESHDGHVRAFDADARGTVLGNGIAVVALKRIESAIEDRDHIYAIVKGSAINNDGRRKVGYTAPSVDGQAEVIRFAYQAANVEPETISYLETHGTGTILGDPIEIEALKKAFNSDIRQFCAIGSVKTNIGHLDAGGGAAGFIKSVLSLKNKLLFPSLNYKTPNPMIDFKNSPFYVNTVLTPWKNNGSPLRAGVNSMGVGGTNAHIVLEETPELFKFTDSSPEREQKLVIISAKNQATLDIATKNMTDYLQNNKDVRLSDVAYSLQLGRKAFKYRKIVVSSNTDETIQILSTPVMEKIRASVVKEENIPIIFMFPGQGAQYVRMGQELYQTEPVFRKEINYCFEILSPIIGYDLKDILYPPLSPIASKSSLPQQDINQTEVAQPLLFSFEYALAKLMNHWGIVPQKMIGHSIGEYVAACLSDVLPLEDALKLVALRGRLMQQMTPGSMVAVFISETELIPLLEINPEISLAAVNSTSNCIISGPHEDVAAFEKLMTEKEIGYRRLHTSHAFHSKMMEPMMEEYENLLKQIQINNPSIPYISNVTGKPMKYEDVSKTTYWIKHLRETVRFSDGLDELLKDEYSIFVEVGPGNVLSSFVKNHQDKKNGNSTINMVRHPNENISDTSHLMNQVGNFWLLGIPIDWKKWWGEEKRNRVPLPTYPFEKIRCWSEKEKMEIGSKISLDRIQIKKKSNIADWFYVPLWKQAFRTAYEIEEKPEKTNWLIFADQWGIGYQLVNRLEKNGPTSNFVIIVKEARGFNKISEREYTIDPSQREHYDTILNEFSKISKVPHKIVHFWGVTRNDKPSSEFGPQEIDGILDSGFYSLLYMVQAIGKHNYSNEIQIHIVTNNMQEVTGEENLNPLKAPVIGAIKVIPKEYPGIKCSSIDIVLPESGSLHNEKLLDQLISHFNTGCIDNIIAFRGKYRWIQTFEPLQLKEPQQPAPQLREKGVYLITGGMGGVGFIFARYLAKTFRARLILTGRSSFLSRQEWHSYLETHEKTDPVSSRIFDILEMEKWGAEIVLEQADITNEVVIAKVIDSARDRFGTINGIIHTAGVADYNGMIQRRTREMADTILAPKVKGTLILDRILKEKHIEPEFFVLFSSLSSVLAPFGEVGYVAANIFLDTFAHHRNSRIGAPTVSINWGTWLEKGMAVEAVKRFAEGKNIDNPMSLIGNGILSIEGINAFIRILQTELPQIAVSPEDLPLTLQRQNSVVEKDFEDDPSADNLAQRPELSTEFIAPGNKVEQIFGDILKHFLKVQEVGVGDNFFELGLTSLDLVMISNQLKKKLMKNIPVALMFEYPTIRSLAQHLEQQELEGNSNDCGPDRADTLDKGKIKLKQLKKKTRDASE